MFQLEKTCQKNPVFTNTLGTTSGLPRLSHHVKPLIKFLLGNLIRTPTLKLIFKPANSGLWFSKFSNLVKKKLFWKIQNTLSTVKHSDYCWCLIPSIHWFWGVNPNLLVTMPLWEGWILCDYPIFSPYVSDISLLLLLILLQTQKSRGFPWFSWVIGRPRPTSSS